MNTVAQMSLTSITPLLVSYIFDSTTHGYSSGLPPTEREGTSVRVTAHPAFCAGYETYTAGLRHGVGCALAPLLHNPTSDLAGPAEVPQLRTFRMIQPKRHWNACSKPFEHRKYS